MITYFLDLYDQIVNYFGTANVSAIILILQITSWTVSALLLWMIAVLLKRSDAGWWIREGTAARQFAYGTDAVQRWEQIKARLQKGDEANRKLAVIEADNLIDEILKRMGLPGNTFEEKMKQIEVQEIKSADKILEGHRTRNMIVHQPNFSLSQEEAEKALADFEEALKELEYLS